MRVFKKMELKKIFGSRRDKVTGNWKKMHDENFIICTFHQKLLE